MNAKIKTKDIKVGDIATVWFYTDKDHSAGETFVLEVISKYKNEDNTGYIVNFDFVINDKVNTGSVSFFCEGKMTKLIDVVKKRYSKNKFSLTSKKWNSLVERTFTKKRWEMHLLELDGGADNIAKAASMLDTKEEVIEYMKSHLEETMDTLERVSY